jgi:hypothetical protein
LLHWFVFVCSSIACPVAQVDPWVTWTLTSSHGVFPLQSCGSKSHLKLQWKMRFLLIQKHYVDMWILLQLVNLPQTKFKTDFPCIMNFGVATASKGGFQPLVELLMKVLELSGRWHCQDSGLRSEATGNSYWPWLHELG